MTHVAEADHLLAGELAEEAGRLLLELRESHHDAAGELRDAGDRLSHRFLLGELHRRRPTDAVLSEEDDAAASGPDRHAAARVWIVDPLDGTREFGEPGRVDWAVHVALVVDGEPVAGAVALPALGEVWSTARPVAIPPGHSPRPRLAVSRTRPGPAAAVLATALQPGLVPMGSAGVKTIAVVRGDAEIYAHSGGQYEWDSAAPVAVALACGAHASRLDGSPLRYNNADPYLPDLLIANPQWAGRALDALAES